MTKDQLIEPVKKDFGRNNISKRLVGEILDTAFLTIQKAIRKNKRFSYPGFGTFSIRNRKARKGRNP